jgi:hypothetical protein
MKQFILIISIISLISCTDSVDDNDNSSIKSTTQTAWEANHLLGEVKSWQTETFDVSDYKFGEPVYVKQYQSTTLFNPYGFVKTSESTFTSKYYNNNFEEEMIYINEELGLIKERKYKSITDDESSEFFQEFQYDSLNRRRQRIHRNLITMDEKFSKWDYQDGQERITDYDENMNLSEVQIKKFDENHNIISDVTYNKDGELERGSYFSYDRDELFKDSIVLQYSFGKYVNTHSYDRVGRLVYQESYEIEEDGSISDLEGSFVEYDSNDLYTSHVIKEFKGDKSIILQKYRVEIKTDGVGNRTEEIKVNTDTNRIVEKQLFTYQYY